MISNSKLIFVNAEKIHVVFVADKLESLMVRRYRKNRPQ
jgi:hypothetical protein